MNTIIDGKTYAISVVLYWGSDKTDINKNPKTSLNMQALECDNIIQLDMISTLSTPFVYGSLIYSDPKATSKLVNLIDMPIIHGRVSMLMVDGTDIPGSTPSPKQFNDEYFVEDVVITGIDSFDGNGDDSNLVKFEFASEDILNFMANVSNVSTFDKSNSDQEGKCVNDVIKELFGSVKLSDKLDINSFKVNSDNKVMFINSSNDNLLTSLEYVYRKTFDDNFKKTGDCSYVRMVYNTATHKYEQWTYDNVGTNKLLHKSSNDDENMIRNMITVDLGKPGGPSCGHSKFHFGNSGSDLDELSNYQKVRFTDFNYKKNEFSPSEYEMMDKLLFKNTNEYDSTMVTRASIINKNGDKFKDVDYMSEFTTSKQDGSIYDILTDTIFNSNFYRVMAKGSVGRKAGDEVFIQFSEADLSMYETMRGDYLITAIDNRYEKRGKNGAPSLTSIMDVHRPFITSDSIKHEMYDGI